MTFTIGSAGAADGAAWGAEAAGGATFVKPGGGDEIGTRIAEA